MSTPEAEAKQAAEMDAQWGIQLVELKWRLYCWTTCLLELDGSQKSRAIIERIVEYHKEAIDTATAKLREGQKHSREGQKHSLEVMAEVINECADFIQRHYESLFGDEYIRKEDILRNAKLVYELYQSRQLETVTRGTFALHKIEQLASQQPSATTPDVEKIAREAAREVMIRYAEGQRGSDIIEPIAAALAQAREPLVKAVCELLAELTNGQNIPSLAAIERLRVALTGTEEKR